MVLILLQNQWGRSQAPVQLPKETQSNGASYDNSLGNASFASHAFAFGAIRQNDWIWNCNSISAIVALPPPLSGPSKVPKLLT